MDKELEILVAQWKSLKEAENTAKEKRLAVEEKILSQVEKPLMGSLKLGDIKISFGKTTKWDTANLLPIIDLEKAKKDESFPFKIELSEDKRKMVEYAIEFNEDYQKLSAFKTEVDKKPSFSLIEKKEA